MRRELDALVSNPPSGLCLCRRILSPVESGYNDVDDNKGHV